MLDAAKADLLSGATINGEILRYTKKDDYFGLFLLFTIVYSEEVYKFRLISYHH